MLGKQYHSGVYVISSAGQHLILVYGRRQIGFILGTFLICNSKLMSLDYHNKMDSSKLHQIVENQLIPRLHHITTSKVIMLLHQIF
jgi:hypothetical protein